MDISEKQIAAIVEEVVRKVRAEVAVQEAKEHPTSSASALSGDNGIFDDIEKAIAAAEVSFEALHRLSLEKRKDMIAAMRKAAIDNAARLAEIAVRETGLGRVGDKTNKNLLVATKTPGTEDLVPVTYTGDDGLTLVEPSPYGVLGVLTPITNPGATIICNGIGMIAAGNSAVFNPHPKAKEVTNEAIRVLNKAIVGAGGPPNLLCSTREPTLESSNALMNHKKIRMLMVTGGPGVVKVAMQTGKKVIAAGPGNPPVIVDDTADLALAGREIVNGASFDNCVLCTGEKEVFSFAGITDTLKEEMKRNGAYEITGKQIEEMTRVAFKDPHAKPHPQVSVPMVGKDASYLLKQIGVDVGPEVRLVIFEAGFDHPFVQGEQLMPVLPIVRVNDLEEALRLSKEAEHGFRHTASMYSNSLENLSYVSRYIDTTIFVKNAPTYAGLGMGGEGYATLSIAGPTGEGLTCPRSFTRQRRCTLKDAFRIV